MNNVSITCNLTGQININEYLDKKNETQYVVNVVGIINEPKRKGESITTPVNLTAFERNAKIIKDFTVKGSKIAVTGKLRKDKYEKDGETRYKDYILVSFIELLDSKEETEKKRIKATEKNEVKNVEKNNQFPYLDDEDMPF
ncbi:single-stranded DNA-binding protein [Staphylococcus aureus]|uniref:single-stranded DNA-binding protein n=1 Tax=Staphylococcus aureus TaxID=1280 RepID=UPI002112F9A9|nr:single-stranded DNA-binding protein [Staphylococcus aureus]MCQ6827900.1 single-stranded DNA-binding protein [Staphylococcus aureus]